MIDELDSILFRRLRYMLSPQLDLYRSIGQDFLGDVLEVGFGTGFGTLQLASNANKVLAIEIDQAAVEFARYCLPVANVEWQRRDVLELEPYLNCFDTVVMVEVLEHIEDWEKVLTLLHQALMPKGKLIMTARNAKADLRRNELHEREWTGGELLVNLGRYFQDVSLYDYTLNKKLFEDTHTTPLIAVARKG